jgi:hypothetical protein
MTVVIGIMCDDGIVKNSFVSKEKGMGDTNERN